MPSTPNFHVLTALKCMEPMKQEYMEVVLCQYSGQDPDQIVSRPEEFFGTREEPTVDAIFFLVDLVDTVERDQVPIPDAELVEHYAQDGLLKVKQRIEENLQYLALPHAQTVIRTSQGKGNRLCQVRVLVNKIDLLHELSQKRYIPPTDRIAVERFIHEQYDGLIKGIRTICKKHQIEDFDSALISVKKGEGLDGLLEQLWRRLRGGGNVSN